METENIDDKNSQIEVLRGILSEVQDLNTQLARIDERSQQNRDDVETIREERISPLEQDVITNENRSRRNSLILGAGVTLLTISAGSIATYSVSLL